MDILTLRSAEAAWHTTNGATRLCLAAAVLMIAGGAAAARTVTSANVQHAGASGEFVSAALGDSGQDGDGTADDGVFTARVPAYAGELPRYLFTYELTVVEAPAVDVGTTPTTLFINELMASNDGTIADPQGDEDDWIELLNAGSETIDLTGMYLSDKSSRPLKWQFPADTSIAAGGYLLVWADDDAGDSPGLHASFKLSAGGESVVLSDVDARDNALIDSVDFPALAADVSYGRAPEATGPFGVLAVASPGAATPVVPELAIDADGAVTEGGRATFNVTAVPAPSADLAVNLVVTQGAGQAYLPASPPTSVTVAAGATEATLGVEIPNDAVDEPHGVLTATLASGAGYTLGSVASASVAVWDDDPGPSDGGVVVNELMASNGGTALDPQGEDDDWIELHNTAARQIDLSGMYLSDNRDKPKKWSFPAGTVIQRNGYLLVWADEDTDDSPGLHADFKLSAGGESVVLSDTDDNGNAVIDAVDFPALARDASYAREPEGTGPFRVVSAASPGVAALPPGTKLSGLTLSGIDIGTFAGDTYLYAASVASEVAVTTVSATANDAASTVTILPADADAETRGHQVQLVVGATVVAVTVTANGGQSGTYGVTVTRAPPPPVATLTAVTGAVAEGAGAAFTVMLDRAADAALTVAVSVTQDGEVLASEPAGSVSIASGETRATLEVATGDDSVVEADGSLTATLTAGTGYTVGEPAAATVTVSDDDAATFAVTAAPNPIEEGGSATVTVSITNGTTYAGDRTVSLSVSGLAAGSYTLEPATAVLAAGAMSVTATFTALADEAEEAPETARIAATVDGAEVGAAELSVEDPAPPPGITLLRVDFDATALGEYTASAFRSDWPSVQGVSGLGSGRAEIIGGPSAFSGRSLRLKYPVGTYGSRNQAIQALMRLPENYEELYVSYRVRFAADFDFVKGGKLPGLTGGAANTGGNQPNGRDGWSGRMTWGRGGDAFQYLYHPDQPGIYGEGFRWDRRFELGRWHTVEHRFVMNTPRVYDGILQTWFDGRQALYVDNLRFRDVDSFAIDHFYISTFFGGGDDTWAPTKDEYISFDDFIISTARIQWFDGGLSEAAAPEGLTAPEGLRVTASTATTLTVAWGAPLFEGRSVYDYDVQYAKLGESAYRDWEHAGRARETTITGLRAGNRYQVRVRARNAGGFGAWSVVEGTPADGDSLPFATITAGGDVIEGAAAVFEVALHKTPAAAITVAVAVSETGEMLAESGPMSVAFAAGETRQSVEITTADDGLVDADSVVTAALSAGSGYALGVPSTADVSVTGAVAALPPGAKLSGLRLSGIDIGTFAGDTFLYAASVGSAVTVTTVSATANDAGSTVTILPADADAETHGHQVQLVVGATVVEVTVTADGGQSGTYGVTVTRAPPPPVATLTAVTGAVAEGARAAFTVTLDRAADAALTVAVSVTRDGEVVASEPAGSVSIASGETRATLEVATDDDSVVEADGSLTATLTAGTGYTVGEPAAATVTVWDDDAAVFEVTAAPDPIEEGGSATVTVSITNGATFAGDRTVSLSATGLDADEYRLEPAAAVLAAGATSVTATFTALEDDAGETPETARIAATVDGAEVGAAELTVEDAGPGPRIAGVPQVGGVLEAVLDDTVADPATAWQWLRDGTSIIGATAREHVLVAADAATALSVRVQARGRERTSAATMPVWPAPANPPLAADEEELLGTTLTLGSRTFGVGVAGFSRLPGREFGSVEDAAFAAGDRELTLFMMNKWGNLGLATTPALPDADGLTAYWDGYPIRPLAAREVDDRPVWIGRTPQPPEEFERYVTGASDGVRVAVSLRRPLPAATLSVLSGTVPEGSAATFEVALDRAAWSALTVSLSVIPDGAVLAEAAPVSVAFAAGESRATVTLATVDDAVIEGDGAVAVTLVSGDGYMLGEETSASVTVEDDDEAVFAVSAAAGELDEGGTTTLTVEVANGKTFAADQSITLSASGSASASDYRLSPATLALPVGETSAAATLTAVRDVAAEPAETVTATATHDGSAVGSATVTIRANEAVVSTATVSAVSGTVTEGAAAEFEVCLDAAALAALSVTVTVSETASMLSGAAPPAVTFAVGESQKTVSLATTDDTVVEADSDVTLGILPGGGYTAGAASSAAVTVADDDAAIFEVSASPEEIDEGGSSTLTVSIAKGVTFAADQSIALSVSGSASAADYGLAPETPTLAAGATSVTATLTAVDDADEESAETATVTATHGGLEAGSATVTIRASDIPSDDASLASLVLSDVDIGTFSPEATDYAAEVPSELSSTTVTVAASDAGAVLEIADAVGSTLGETRTVRLEEGDNAIAVTVTAEDGATTRAYRVAVTRAYPAAWGEPLPQRDIELGARAGPTGLWSDGATLWVIWDWRSGAVRAYDLDDGSLLAERGFELTDGSGFPSGLWSDGTTLWVSDFYGGVTAHRLSDGTRLPAEDLDGDILSAAGNSGPSGLWSDGTTLWVADDRSWKAFAYRLSDKSRLASQEVSFLGNGDPVSPWGLWSDGETLLVSDPRRGMLHGYRLSDGAWQAQRTVNLSAAGVRIPMGLWSDGRVLWVASELETTVHAYAVPGLRRAAAGTFPVRVSSRAPRVPGAAQGGRSVGIPDAALRARIAAALGKPADAALGERELAALTALDARAAGVADLTGLQYAVHLAALDLGDNALVDLRALADLPALTVLNLDRTGADPRSLARLTGLRRLSLRGNGLGDVEALRSLTALRVLDIGANRVVDLSPLGGLSALEALRADGNAVQDASALRAMGLRILDLDGDASAGRSP